MSKTFVPDTNFFLQCRDPSELPWTEVTDSPSICVLVVEEVLGELDRLKGDGNARRAKRARKYCSLLRPLVMGPQSEVVLREANPRVTIAFAPLLEETINAPKADQRIVLEALASAVHITGGVELLSADSGPIRFAAKKGLPCTAIPEGWLLEPEANEEEKRLKAELEVLRQTLPEIELEVDGAVPIEWNVVYYPPLSDKFVDGLVERIVASKPRKERPQKGRDVAESMLVVLIPESDWISYEREYFAWQGKLRECLALIPGMYNLIGVGGELRLLVSNTGYVPADNLEVAIEACGNIKLIEPGGDFAQLEHLKLPQPPKEPRFASFRAPVGAGGYHSNYSVPPIAGFRDRSRFYWDYDGGGLGDKATGECAEFRHQAGATTLPVQFTWGTPQAPSFGASIKVVVSASNLRRPVENKGISVRAAVTLGDSEALANRLVAEEFGLD